MQRCFILLVVGLSSTLQLNAQVCFVIPDPSETGSADSCGKRNACCQCHCQSTCDCCYYNPYQYSLVDNPADEPEPTWPTKLDAPFQDELSR